MEAQDTTDDVGARLYQTLQEIEQRCLAHAVGLPQQPTLEESWEGVLFAIGGRMVVAALGEVKEILNYPTAVTLVPGAKIWVKGVANIRGNLLPIIDLQGFLLGRSTVLGRRSRVLVIDHKGFVSGLLVDEMVGIRHFRPSDRVQESVDLPPAVADFVEYFYGQGDAIWPVFSMRRLSDNTEFQYAAA
jgi:twitching motility protein PilI